MKNKHKILLRTGILSIIIIMMLGVLNTFFNPVWQGFNEYYTINGFYKEPSDRVETVFLGSSVAASDIAPMELYKNHGICAYNLSTSEQPVIASYYLLEEAYKLHSETLKNVFFEVSQLRDNATDQTLHKAFDYMKLSPIKIRAVYDYCDGDYSKMMTFLYPFTEYHNRWSELEASDFEFFGKNPLNGTRGYAFVTYTYRSQTDSLKDIPIKSTKLNEDAQEVELQENSIHYFDKMVNFCNEHGLNLVLIKLPANNWNSSLSKTIKSVSEIHGLDFLDFNFESVASELDYNHAFDSRDGRHTNFFGALKITKWLGNYIVKDCEYTDVRNNKKYYYLEKQAERYDKVFYRTFEMSQTDNVSDYLSVALRDNNSIVLTVKEDAAGALSESQREYFAQIGLLKLSDIKNNDAYVGFIDNGKIIYEDVLAKTDDENNFISYEGSFSNGEQFTVASGFMTDGYKSSCTVNKKEESRNQTGINILVYNNEYGETVNSANFNTSKSESKQYYGVDFCKLFDDSDAVKENMSNQYFRQALIYSKMVEYKNKGINDEIIEENNDVFSFIDKYKDDKNNVIIITVKDDASTKLTDETRKLFAKYGLRELSDLGLRDSYIGIIENGKVIFEKREHGSTKPVVYTKDEFSIKSAGFAAGNLSSVKINGEEFSLNIRGLNIVIYNRELKYILDSKHFDTYSNEIKLSAKPETAE